MTKQTGTSPWTYVAIGCAAVIGVAIVGALAVGFMGYRFLQDARETMTDPQSRAQKVRELLATDALPEGYHPSFTLSIPLLGEIAILADKPSGEDGEPDFDERAFLYASLRNFGDRKSQFRDFVEGRAEEAEVLDNIDIDLDIDYAGREPLARGSFLVPQGELVYASYRARVRGPRARASEPRRIVTLFSVECEADERLKMGIWFGPDPSLDAGAAAEPAGEPAVAAQEELAGTPADPAALEAFVSNFSFCSN